MRTTLGTIGLGFFLMAGTIVLAQHHRGDMPMHRSDMPMHRSDMPMQQNWGAWDNCPFSSDPGWIKNPQHRTGMHNMMQGMGATPEMMDWSRGMAYAPHSPYDPGVILGLKEELELTEDQVSKLEAILGNAREEAKTVLNEGQLAEVKGLPESPRTMMGMWGHMDRMMQKWHEANPDRGPQVCPLHMMMYSEAASEES